MEICSGIFDKIKNYICYYMENVSLKIKVPTLILFLVMIGLLVANIHHIETEKEAKVLIQSIADHVIDPKIENLNSMQDSNVFQTTDITNFFIASERIFLLMELAACVVIGLLTNLIKTPFIYIKKFVDNMLEKLYEDRYSYIPIIISSLINLIEVLCILI